MKIMHRDMKGGRVKLRVQNLDDLWHLYNIIRPGDLVFSLTSRREGTRADAVRAERGEKRKMWLGIRVEKVEFHEFADWLRLHGIIEEGPQDIGAYHTLNITAGQELEVVKEWTGHHLGILEQAEKATERPRLTCVAIDDDEAVVAQLREYGIRQVAVISSGRSGKFYRGGDQGPAEFFGEIASVLAGLQEKGPLVILGPGFAKENLAGYLRQRDPDMVDEIVSSGQAGMTGIQEIMKRGIGARLLEDTRVGMETRLVERLLAEIGRDGLCAYGPDEVRAAADAGAIDTLLVSSQAARDGEYGDIMDSAGDSGSRVVLVSEHHDAGKKLLALGGIGAILRFRFQ